MVQQNNIWENLGRILVQFVKLFRGKVNGEIVDDLDYEMDSNADVDLNLVMNSSYEIIEIQGTGEKGTFSTTELNEMINLGKKCIEKIFKEQEKILNNND